MNQEKRTKAKTRIEYVPAKTIVTRNKTKSWFGTDYTMNIYRGCCHGCIYCDSRSECYRIEEFDRVRAKENALETIRNDLRRKTVKGVIQTGSMSDPYNPYEKKLQLTGRALELVDAYGFGIAIATKGTTITRDVGILEGIKEHSPVLCKVTITAANDELGKIVEPNAPLSSERFEAVAKLSDKGIFAGILMTPVLPMIEDTEENILGIVHKSKECGAKFVFPTFGMTLRANQRAHYYDRLDEAFPGMRETYEKRYGNQYVCSSPKKALQALFAKECDKRGILHTMSQITLAYKRGYGDQQMNLFDFI